MIFKLKKKKLQPIFVQEFKREKDIQRLVEENLNLLLGYDFLASEFVIDSFRFDSVAFDNKNKAFVIIEYKKDKNVGLLDQGFTYLETLLKYKADFVLLYNKSKKTFKDVSDFNWSNNKLVFIAYEFTDHQLKFAPFKNFVDCRLYEIKQYCDGIIEFTEKEISRDRKINKNLDVMNFQKPKNIEVKQNEIKQTEQVIYSEEIHLARTDSNAIKQLYYELKKAIIEFGNIIVEPKKWNINFKLNDDIICGIVFCREFLDVFINLKYGKLDDEKSFCKIMVKEDGKEIGHWASGDYRARIKDMQEFDYVLSLISQSYEKHLKKS